jgi:hypothetical protein
MLAFVIRPKEAGEADMRLGILVAAAAASVALGGSAHAHHSYAEFDRSAVITVEGTVEQVDWTNPHVIILVRTAEGEDFRIEWWGTQRLSRAGLPENPFAIGDQIALTGSPHRDPQMRVLTLLTKVDRPADGWSWRRSRRFGPGGSGRLEVAAGD